MLDNWYLFNRDVYVGILTYNEESKKFSFRKENEGKLVDEAIKLLNLDRDSDAIWFMLEDRCFPPDRVNARELLDELNLIEYDKWSILKKTHLCDYNDNIWMSKEKDGSQFFKINPRGIAGL